MWVATTDEVPPGSRAIVDAGEMEIAVFNIDGEYYGVANYCVHAAGPLCEGEVTGKTTVGDDGWSLDFTDAGKIISCPWHQWKFDIRTGKNIDDDKYAVPTYEVEVEGDDIYILR